MHVKSQSCAYFRSFFVIYAFLQESNATKLMGRVKMEERILTADLIQVFCTYLYQEEKIFRKLLRQTYETHY